MKEKTLQQVVVEWEDATVHFNLMSLDEANHAKVCINKTAGWLLSSSRKYLRVASEVSSNGDFRQVTVIPKSWGLKIHKKKG